MKSILILLFLSLYEVKAQTKLSYTLYFDLNSSEIRVQDKAELDSVLIQKLNDIDITRISSYCDTTGTIEYNKSLANKRAQALIEILKSKGYRQNIPVIAYGEKYPDPGPYKDTPALMRKVVVEYSAIKTTNQISSSSSLSSDTIANQTSVFDNLTIDNVLSEESEAIVLDIQFYPGEDILIGNSYNELDKLFQFVRRNESLKVFIRGHVCCGSDMYLSYARAYVVYNYLINRGISPKRLDVKGFDNTLPRVTPEVTDEDRQKNRRVDIVFSLSVNNE